MEWTSASSLMVPPCNIVALHVVSDTRVSQSEHADDQVPPAAAGGYNAAESEMQDTPPYQDPSASPSCLDLVSSSSCWNHSASPSFQDPETNPSYKDPSASSSSRDPTTSPSCQNSETFPACRDHVTSLSYKDRSASSSCNEIVTSRSSNNSAAPPSCDHDPVKPAILENGVGRSGSRRQVRFAERLVSGYIEPNDSLATIGSVPLSVVAEEYRTACRQHHCQPLDGVTRLLEGEGGGVLSLQGVPLRLPDCEALEAVLRRVQFAEIDVSRCRLDDGACAALIDMIDHYHSAHTLQLSQNPLLPAPTTAAAGTHTWHALAHLVRTAALLRRVSAASLPLSERSAAELARALALSSGRTSLRELCLDGCGLHGRAASLLATALRHCSSLRHLSLADNQLTAGDACLLGHTLAASRRLHVLELQRNCLGDAGVQQLLRAVARQPECRSQQEEAASSTSSSSSDDEEESRDDQPGLLSLNLWANEFGDDSASAIAHLLQVHDTLHTLNIGGNAVGDATMLALQEALAANTSLRQLGLQACQVGDAGARALGAALRTGAQRLVRVDLRGNSALGAPGLVELAAAVQERASLQRLDLPQLQSELLHLQQQIDDSCALNRHRAETAAAAAGRDHPHVNAARDERTQLARKVSAVLRRVSLTCEAPAKPATPRRLVSPDPSPSGSPGRFHIYRVDAHGSLRVRHISSESEDAATPPASPVPADTVAAAVATVPGSRVLLRPIDPSVAQMRRSPVRGFVVTPVAETRLPAERA